FTFKRTQFPIRLSFAMTINKSQGQTLDFVGIYLPQPVFSHGQLYVALSRAKTASTIRILLRPVSTERREEREKKEKKEKEEKRKEGKRKRKKGKKKKRCKKK
ncbi:hypothetical protein CIPAW_13G170000, partial [Carya illinoinensis]